MNSAWLQIIGIGILTGVPTAAQSPQSTTSREVIRATGCVQVAGADGVATGDGLGSGFVLKGVRVAPHVGLLEAPRATAPGTPSGNAGTPSSNEGSQATNTADPGSGAPAADARASGTDIASPRDSGLLLVADRGVDLAGHVGHRVLVTGRLSSFAAAGGVASTSSGRTLTVTKVDLIAPACTTGS